MLLSGKNFITILVIFTNVHALHRYSPDRGEGTANVETKGTIFGILIRFDRIGLNGWEVF